MNDSEGFSGGPLVLAEHLDMLAQAGGNELSEVERLTVGLDLLQERIAELELELEDVGWIRETHRGQQDFTPSALRRIVDFSRIMYLKNPLIQSGVQLVTNYVFSQGFTVKCSNETAQSALDDFIQHPKNLVELTDHDARMLKDQRLAQEGTLFFALITKPGATVIVRTIPIEEILEGDIICNPQDRREVWYYKRKWKPDKFDIETGKMSPGEDRTDYYPDWQYRPANKPPLIGSHEVHWDQPVMRVKVGGLDEMKYGVPETYAAIPWAKAYVRDMENYATIREALARFAWNVTVKGGKPAINAVRTKLASSVSLSEPIERNPKPTTASTWVGNEGYKLDPIRTAGAQPGTEESRGLRNMAGTAFGIPDTILAGDAGIGSLATAKTLDRPTELMMRNRQTLWANVLRRIYTYAISVRLGDYVRTYGDDDLSEAATGPAVLSVKYGLDINFPPILERDSAGRVTAVISAATLDGKSRWGGMTDKYLVKLLHQALGADEDLDEVLAKLKFDKDDMLEKIPAPGEPPPMPPGTPGAPSPGGPKPGPKPGAPPDRKAQGLAKNEPAATPSETSTATSKESLSPDQVIAAVRKLREALELDEERLSTRGWLTEHNKVPHGPPHGGRPGSVGMGGMPGPSRAPRPGRTAARQREKAWRDKKKAAANAPPAAMGRPIGHGGGGGAPNFNTPPALKDDTVDAAKLHAAKMGGMDRAIVARAIRRDPALAKAVRDEAKAAGFQGVGDVINHNRADAVLQAVLAKNPAMANAVVDAGNNAAGMAAGKPFHGGQPPANNLGWQPPAPGAGRPPTIDAPHAHVSTSADAAYQAEQLKLATMPIADISHLGGGITSSFKGHLEDGTPIVVKYNTDNVIGAVRKNVDGNEVQHEIAAGIVGQAFAHAGVNVNMPVVTSRQGVVSGGAPKSGTATVMSWVNNAGSFKDPKGSPTVALAKDAGFADHAFSSLPTARKKDFALADAIMGATDRHGGNYFVQTIGGKDIHPIDNGLNFPFKKGDMANGGFDTKFAREGGGHLPANAALEPRHHAVIARMKSAEVQADLGSVLNKESMTQLNRRLDWLEKSGRVPADYSDIHELHG